MSLDFSTKEENTIEENTIEENEKILDNECCICYNNVNEIKTSCGHKYCKICLIKCIKQCDIYYKKCSFCRQKITDTFIEIETNTKLTIFNDELISFDEKNNRSNKNFEGYIPKDRHLDEHYSYNRTYNSSPSSGHFIEVFNTNDGITRRLTASDLLRINDESSNYRKNNTKNYKKNGISNYVKGILKMIK